MSLFPAMAFSTPGFHDFNILIYVGVGTPPSETSLVTNTVARDSGWMEHSRRETPGEKRWNPEEKEQWRQERNPQKWTPREPHVTLLAVKTNLPAWATATLNAAVEVRVGRQWTIELPVTWSPWHVAREHAARVFALQPEVRRWLRSPGEGWFAGAHVHATWFNVRWKHDRYQSADRPLLGAGVSLGYALSLHGRWGAEFSAGAGYASIKYDTYYNIANGARVSTRTRDYWGVTRARIAVTWRLGKLKVKN